MTEAVIILLNMRGGCATVGNKVHTLFRVNNRRPRQIDTPEKSDGTEAQVDRTSAGV